MFSYLGFDKPLLIDNNLLFVQSIELFSSGPVFFCFTGSFDVHAQPVNSSVLQPPEFERNTGYYG